MTQSESDINALRKVGYVAIYQYLDDCKNGIHTIEQFISWLHKPKGQELCDIAGLNPEYLERGIKERIGTL